MEKDQRDLLFAFNEQQVKFLVVGMVTESTLQIASTYLKGRIPMLFQK